MPLSLKYFDYHLPSELIAQEPVKPRDHSRLLLLNKSDGAIGHKYFYNITDYLKSGDVLVLNNSQVFPARLVGKKAETGGKVEIFLHKKTGRSSWECLVGGRVNIGLVVDFSAGLSAKLICNNNDGTWQVKFNQSGAEFWKTINKIGIVPLPPYIKRSKKEAGDKSNYQTVFADKHKVGSAAAPTAGLHFTGNLLKKIKAKGVKIIYVTLHVGLGTFAPVKTDNILDHKMHSEFAEISVASQRSILEAKKLGKRVIAVGTTSCRTLESADFSKNIFGQKKNQRIKAQSFWTDIFIYPGYQFKIVDALITNFHLPKSTLLMLVSALAGKKNIDKAYAAAIEQKYRFFSYGDAMFIY